MTFLNSLKQLREVNPTLATLLVYILKLLHVFFVAFDIIGPFIFDNILILMSIIILEIVILLQWYIYGICLLTPIENALSGKANSTFISFLTEYLESILSKKGAYAFWTFKPFFVVVVCLYKIYYLKITCKGR